MSSLYQTGLERASSLVTTTPSDAETKLLQGTAIIVMGIDQELNKLAQTVQG